MSLLRRHHFSHLYFAKESYALRLLTYSVKTGYQNKQIFSTGINWWKKYFYIFITREEFK